MLDIYWKPFIRVGIAYIFTKIEYVMCREVLCIILCIYLCANISFKVKEE